jgi:O-antigen/teichoic acid export membrane protein
MNLRRTIVQSIQSRAWLLLLSTAIILINTRTLGPEGQGQIAWIQLGLLLVTGASGFIAGGAVVFLQKEIPLRATLLPGHIWLIASSIGATALGIQLGFLPAHHMMDIALLGWLQGVIIFHGQLLLGAQNVRAHNQLQVMQNAFVAIGLILAYFVWEWRHVDAFLAVLALSLGLTALLSLFSIGKLPQSSNPPPFRHVVRLLWKHGSAAQTGGLLQMLTNRTNFSLLARSAGQGAAATGIYSVAFYGLEAIWLVARGLAPVVHARTANNPDRERRIQETGRFLGVAILGTLPLATLAALIPDAWYALVVGFGGIQPVILRLLPAAIAGAMASILAHHLSGIGQHRWNAYTSALGLAVLSVCAWQWIPVTGINGAAYAASAAAVAQTIGLIVAWCHCEQSRFTALWPRFRATPSTADDSSEIE